MIYLLEFAGSLYEFNYSSEKPARMLRSVIERFPDMMILHRYSLFFYSWNKFQTKNPDKIDISRLDGKNAMLFHLDIYRDCSEKIVPLIEHCGAHRNEIRDILERYEHVVYDFTNAASKEDLEKRRKEMLRDISIRKLVG